MSSTVERDKKVLKRREDRLPDEVQVSLREQVIDKLVARLEKDREGWRTKELWEAGNMRRADRLRRREKLLRDFDEFLEPIYDAAHEWSSTFHLPIIYTVTRTVHARMLSALMDIDPPFTMKARAAARAEQTDMVEDFMRYAVKDWLNFNQGCDDEVDKWVWDWVCSGTAIMKNRWERCYEKFVDVVEEPALEERTVINEETGDPVNIPVQVMKEVEREVVEEIFNGPTWEALDEEDVLLIGGKGDPQKAESVIHGVYLTAGDLWTMSDQKLFREKSVKAVLEWGESNRLSEPNQGIKIEKAENAGVSDVDNELDSPKYLVLERYTKLDVFGGGIPTEVVLWVHKETGEILRATYLRRMKPSGTRPFHKIDYHKRFGEETGVGLPEILYTLQREIDAIHNMKMDFGLVSSMPFGYYRATSNLSEEAIPLEPGIMIPVNDPQSDVYFPNIGAKWAFTAQEEGFLLNQVERVTSISELSMGIIAGQGATRTATGTRALVGESNANLNVFLRRLNRGWKSLLTDTFQDLQVRAPEGLQFRVNGEGGHSYWREMKSREEIAGKWDFELDSNSANSNKAVKVEVASQIYQITSNPLDYQLGIFTPLERYEAVVNVLKANGVKDFGRFVRKPAGIQRVFTPEEIANRVLRGVDVPFTPEQDVQGFIAYVDEIIDNDELLGQFNEEQTVMLARKRQEAVQMMRAMEAAAAQSRNSQQVQTNAGLAQQGPTEANIAPGTLGGAASVAG